MFVFFNVSILLALVIAVHAALGWFLLSQPKPTPVKPVQPPIQISFIQLQPKPIAKPIVEKKNVSKQKTITTKKTKTRKTVKRKPIKKVVKPKKKSKPRKTVKKTHKPKVAKSTKNTSTAKIATKAAPTANHTTQSNQTTTQKAVTTQVTKPAPKKPRFNQAYLYQPKPTYTPILKRLNLQGTVKLRIVFAKQGHVKQVSVVNSSGSTRLDNHAMKYVKKYWKYNPPEKQQEWTRSIPIRFQLQ